MARNFPSVWLEYKHKPNKQMVIAGFYRGLTHNGLSKEAAQTAGAEEFSAQIDEAYQERKDMIILGDANLFSKNGWI
jgi:exonuclease III